MVGGASARIIYETHTETEKERQTDTERYKESKRQRDLERRARLFRLEPVE